MKSHKQGTLKYDRPTDRLTPHRATQKETERERAKERMSGKETKSKSTEN